jgi:hypothetical protein
MISNFPPKKFAFFFLFGHNTEGFFFGVEVSMNRGERRKVEVLSRSVEVCERCLRFSFSFDSSEVISGEISYLWAGKGSFIARTLIEQGWLSSTLEECFQYSTEIKFSPDGRNVEIIYKRLPSVDQTRFSEMMDMLRSMEAEEYKKIDHC